MNGRVYDPEIGRFLSADPFIQDITNSQSLNAYAYVNNNPLSYTDPSGFFLSGLFKGIGNFFRAVGRAFASAAKAIVKSGIGRAILQIAACATGIVPVCVAAAAGLTLAAGGSLKEALFAAAISFGQMGAYSIVGGVVKSIGVGTVAAGVVKLGLHAVVGGAFSVAQGGSFMTGAFTGAIAAGTSLMMEGTALGNMPGDGGTIARTAIAAVAGGTASVLSGGKFANGAITGAMAHLYNAENLGRQIAAAGGTFLGGVMGGMVGTAGATACAFATSGACAPLGPSILGAGIAGGGATGYGIATSIYDGLIGGAVYNSGAPELPGELTGENPRPQRGGRINTDLPAHEFPGTVEELTGGQLSPHPKNPDNLCCSNGVLVRPTPAGPRIDIPASGSRPHETIHFPQGTKWPYP